MEYRKKIAYRFQSGFAELAEIFNFYPAFSTTDHGTDNEEQDIGQLVLNLPGLAVILKNWKGVLSNQMHSYSMWLIIRPKTYKATKWW